LVAVGVGVGAWFPAGAGGWLVVVLVLGGFILLLLLLQLDT